METSVSCQAFFKEVSGVAKMTDKKCNKWAEENGSTNFHRCSEESFHTKENCAWACDHKVIVEADREAINNISVKCKKGE